MEKGIKKSLEFITYMFAMGFMIALVVAGVKLIVS